MVTDKYGRDFIASEEGTKLKAYLDQVGIPTIGIGFTYYPSTGKKVKINDIITAAECDIIFIQMLKSFESAVSTGIKVPITQNQFNALVSFSYNVGIGAFSKSTLVKKINASAPLAEIQAQFNLWTKAGGKVLPVLVGRRKREFKLFTTI